jgi:hypothetical protein
MVVAPTSRGCHHGQLPYCCLAGRMARHTRSSLLNDPVPLLNPRRMDVRPARPADASSAAVPIPCFLNPLPALNAAWGQTNQSRTRVCPRALPLRSATLEGLGARRCVSPSSPRIVLCAGCRRIGLVSWGARAGCWRVGPASRRRPVRGVAVRPARGFGASGRRCAQHYMQAMMSWIGGVVRLAPHLAPVSDREIARLSP